MRDKPIGAVRVPGAAYEVPLFDQSYLGIHTDENAAVLGTAKTVTHPDSEGTQPRYGEIDPEWRKP